MDLIVRALEAHPELAQLSVQVIVGEVGSGKSTYSAYLSNNYGALVVCNDAMGMMLRAGNYRASIQDDLYPLYSSIKASALRHGLSRGRTIILDDTNLNRTTRRWVTNKARDIQLEVGINVPIIAVRTPPISFEISGQRRAQHDLRTYSESEWTAIAEKHSKKASEPELTDGFDLIVRLEDFL